MSRLKDDATVRSDTSSVMMSWLSVDDTADSSELKCLVEELTRGQESMARANTRLRDQNSVLELAVKDSFGRLDNVAVHGQLLLRHLAGFSERTTQLQSDIVTALGQTDVPRERL